MPTINMFPIAISSQLDDTGVERIHAAHFNKPIPLPVFVPPEEPDGEYVVVWGEHFERGEYPDNGISMVAAEPFNSELPSPEGDDTLNMVGYYFPAEPISYIYPPPIDPLLFVLDENDFVPLSIGFYPDPSGRWGLARAGGVVAMSYVSGLNYFIVKLQVNDEPPFLGAVFVKEDL